MKKLLALFFCILLGACADNEVSLDCKRAALVNLGIKKFDESSNITMNDAAFCSVAFLFSLDENDILRLFDGGIATVSAYADEAFALCYTFVQKADSNAIKNIFEQAQIAISYAKSHRKCFE